MDAVNLQNTTSQVQQQKASGNGTLNNSAADDSKREEIISVAKKFEALMLHAMLKSMRATIAEDELTGNDGQDMYRDMMDQEIAKNISESGGFGIQQVLAHQLGANMGVNTESGEDSSRVDATMIPGNGASKAKLAQLQQYQEISSANDMMFSTRSSLMQD